MNNKVVTIIFITGCILVLSALVFIPYFYSASNASRVIEETNEGYIQVMPYTSSTPYNIFSEPFTSEDYTINIICAID